MVIWLAVILGIIALALCCAALYHLIAENVLDPLDDLENYSEETHA